MNGSPGSKAAAGTAADTRYVVLTMDGLQLLIPQHQVRTLEPGFDVQYQTTGGPGWIDAIGRRVPVYGLTEGLQPLHQPPANRPVCVLLETDRELFGLLCNQVTLFEQTEPDIAPLPKCMEAPGTPLRGLVLDHGQVLCVGSADSLLACIDDQREPVDAPRPTDQPDGSQA